VRLARVGPKTAYYPPNLKPSPSQQSNLQEV
jgi:hypothetical protein